MNTLSMRVLATVLTIGAALPLAAQDSTAPADVTADTVLATVNGTDITLGHMIIARTKLPAQYQQLPPDVLFEGLLDQLVQQTLLSQTVEGTPRRVELALENEHRSLTAGEALQDLVEGAVTDEALQAAYDEAYANAEAELEYNASHILVETEEEAQAIVTELEGGADFAALAKERSTGPSGPNGGELGWFGKGMMVPPFEEAVVAMEPETVSAPVQTQFGWHVIRLNETRSKAAPTLDEVRDELAQNIQRAAVDARIEELTAGAEISKDGAEGMDPSVLDNIDLLVR